MIDLNDEIFYYVDCLLLLLIVEYSYLVYVIYILGIIGKLKGVMVEYGGIVNLF